MTLDYREWEWLQYLVGVDRPAGSVELLRELSTELGELAGQLGEIGADVDALMGRVQEVYPQGRGGEAMVRVLRELGLGDEGALAQLRSELEAAEKAVFELAGAMRSAQLNFDIALMWLLWELVWAAGLGPGAWPAQQAAVGAARLACLRVGMWLMRRIDGLVRLFVVSPVAQRVLGRLLYEALQEGLVELVQGTAEAGLVEWKLTEEGLQQDWNLDRLVENAGWSLAGGAVYGLIGNRVYELGRRFSWGNAGGLPGATKGLLVGSTAGAAAELVLMALRGEWDIYALTGGAGEGLASAVYGSKIVGPGGDVTGHRPGETLTDHDGPMPLDARWPGLRGAANMEAGPDGPGRTPRDRISTGSDHSNPDVKSGHNSEVGSPGQGSRQFTDSPVGAYSSAEGRPGDDDMAPTDSLHRENELPDNMQTGGLPVGGAAAMSTPLATSTGGLPVGGVVAPPPGPPAEVGAVPAGGGDHIDPPESAEGSDDGVVDPESAPLDGRSDTADSDGPGDRSPAVTAPVDPLPVQHPSHSALLAAQEIVDNPGDTERILADLEEALRARTIDSDVYRREQKILAWLNQTVDAALSVAAIAAGSVEMAAYLRANDGSLVPSVDMLEESGLKPPPENSPATALETYALYWIDRMAKDFWHAAYGEPDHSYHGAVRGFDKVFQRYGESSRNASGSHGEEIVEWSLAKGLQLWAIVGPRAWDDVIGFKAFHSGLIGNTTNIIIPIFIAHGISTVRAEGGLPTVGQFMNRIEESIDRAWNQSTYPRNASHLRMFSGDILRVLKNWEHGPRVDDPFARRVPLLEALDPETRSSRQPAVNKSTWAGNKALRIPNFDQAGAVDEVLDGRQRLSSRGEIDAITFLAGFIERLAAETLYTSWPVTADGTPLGLTVVEPMSPRELEAALAHRGITVSGFTESCDARLLTDYADAVFDLRAEGVTIGHIAVGALDRRHRRLVDIVSGESPGHLQSLKLDPRAVHENVRVEMLWLANWSEQPHDLSPTDLIRYHAGLEVFSQMDEASQAEVEQLLQECYEAQVRTASGESDPAPDFLTWVSTQFGRGSVAEGEIDPQFVTARSFVTHRRFDATDVERRIYRWLRSKLPQAPTEAKPILWQEHPALAADSTRPGPLQFWNGPGLFAGEVHEDVGLRPNRFRSSGVLHSSPPGGVPAFPGGGGPSDFGVMNDRTAVPEGLRLDRRSVAQVLTWIKGWTGGSATVRIPELSSAREWVTLSELEELLGGVRFRSFADVDSGISAEDWTIGWLGEQKPNSSLLVVYLDPGKRPPILLLTNDGRTVTRRDPTSGSGAEGQGWWDFAPSTPDSDVVVVAFAPDGSELILPGTYPRIDHAPVQLDTEHAVVPRTHPRDGDKGSVSDPSGPTGPENRPAASGPITLAATPADEEAEQRPPQPASPQVPDNRGNTVPADLRELVDAADDRSRAHLVLGFERDFGPYRFVEVEATELSATELWFAYVPVDDARGVNGVRVAGDIVDAEGTSFGRASFAVVADSKGRLAVHLEHLAVTGDPVAERDFMHEFVTELHQVARRSGAMWVSALPYRDEAQVLEDLGYGWAGEANRKDNVPEAVRNAADAVLREAAEAGRPISDEDRRQLDEMLARFEGRDQQYPTLRELRTIIGDCELGSKLMREIQLPELRKMLGDPEIPGIEADPVPDAAVQAPGKVVDEPAVEYLCDLVSIPSVSDDAAVCKAMIERANEMLEGRGLHITHYPGKNPSLVATSRPGKKPKVMLAAHLDVVSAPPEEFEARIVDGRVIGRGAYDMKFAFACFLEFLDRHRDDLDSLDFGIMLTTDEEVGGEQGMARLLEDGWRPDVFVLPDSSKPWVLESMAKGRRLVELSVEGPGGHASRISENEDPRVRLARIEEYLRTKYPSLDPNGLTVAGTMLSAPASLNQTPQKIVSTYDVRAFDNEELDEFMKDLRRLARELRADVRILESRPAVVLDQDNPLVREFARAYEDVREQPLKTDVSYGSTDAVWAAKFGIPSIIFAPEGGGSHSKGEWVTVNLSPFTDVVEAFVTRVARAESSEMAPFTRRRTDRPDPLATGSGSSVGGSTSTPRLSTEVADSNPPDKGLRPTGDTRARADDNDGNPDTPETRDSEQGATARDDQPSPSPLEGGSDSVASPAPLPPEPRPAGVELFGINQNGWKGLSRLAEAGIRVVEVNVCLSADIPAVPLVFDAPLGLEEAGAEQWHSQSWAESYLSGSAWRLSRIAETARDLGVELQVRLIPSPKRNPSDLSAHQRDLVMATVSDLVNAGLTFRLASGSMPVLVEARRITSDVCSRLGGPEIELIAEATGATIGDLHHGELRALGIDKMSVTPEVVWRHQHELPAFTSLLLRVQPDDPDLVYELGWLRSMPVAAVCTSNPAEAADRIGAEIDRRPRFIVGHSNPQTIEMLRTWLSEHLPWLSNEQVDRVLPKMKEILWLTADARSAPAMVIIDELERSARLQVYHHAYSATRYDERLGSGHPARWSVEHFPDQPWPYVSWFDVMTVPSPPVHAAASSPITETPPRSELTVGGEVPERVQGCLRSAVDAIWALGGEVTLPGEGADTWRELVDSLRSNPAPVVQHIVSAEGDSIARVFDTVEHPDSDVFAAVLISDYGTHVHPYTVTAVDGTAVVFDTLISRPADAGPRNDPGKEHQHHDVPRVRTREKWEQDPQVRDALDRTRDFYVVEFTCGPDGRIGAVEHHGGDIGQELEERKVLGPPIDDGAGGPADTNRADDPDWWLEESASPEVQEWVRTQNEETLRRFATGAGFEDMVARIQRDLESTPGLFGPPYRDGEWMYRCHDGVWQRVGVAEYREAAAPRWEELLDINALVWDPVAGVKSGVEPSDRSGAGAVRGGFRGSLAGPGSRRILLILSRGGDRHVIVEFDAEKKEIVPAAEGGFFLPEGIHAVTWRGADDLDVATSLWSDTLTTSGYPYQVKRWRRGMSIDELADAEATFTHGDAEDFGVFPCSNACSSGGVGQFAGWRPDSGDGTYIIRWMKHDLAEIYLAEGQGWSRLDVPPDARVFWRGNHLLILLGSSWSTGGQTYPSGSLLAAELDDFRLGIRALKAVFTPDENTVIPVQHSRLLMPLLAHRDFLWVGDDCFAISAYPSQLLVVKFGADGPVSHLMQVGSEPASVKLMGTTGDGFIDVSAETPGKQPIVYSLRADALDGSRQPTLEPLADPNGLGESSVFTTEHTVVSEDGVTEVPYYVTRRRDMTGISRVFMNVYANYGYIDMNYMPGIREWLRRFGPVVTVGARGSGVKGPDWHHQGQREGKALTTQDIAAVAVDLVRRGYTTASGILVYGFSAGGRHAFDVAVKYGHRVGAVVGDAAVLDLLNNDLYGVGKNATYENGDPSDSANWEWLKDLSPVYVVTDADGVPPALNFGYDGEERTSPGHARRITEKAQKEGKPFYYYEFPSGVHGGSAAEAQQKWALIYEFADWTLKPNPVGPHGITGADGLDKPFTPALYAAEGVYPDPTQYPSVGEWARAFAGDEFAAEISALVRDGRLSRAAELLKERADSGGLPDDLGRAVVVKWLAGTGEARFDPEERFAPQREDCSTFEEWAAAHRKYRGAAVDTDQVDVYHGTKVPDPFRFLEDPNDPRSVSITEHRMIVEPKSDDPARAPVDDASSNSGATQQVDTAAAVFTAPGCEPVQVPLTVGGTRHIGMGPGGKLGCASAERKLAEIVLDSSSGLVMIYGDLIEVNNQRVSVPCVLLPGDQVKFDRHEPGAAYTVAFTGLMSPASQLPGTVTTPTASPDQRVTVPVSTWASGIPAELELKPGGPPMGIGRDRSGGLVFHNDPYRVDEPPAHWHFVIGADRNGEVWIIPAGSSSYDATEIKMANDRRPVPYTISPLEEGVTVTLRDRGSTTELTLGSVPMPVDKPFSPGGSRSDPPGSQSAARPQGAGHFGPTRRDGEIDDTRGNYTRRLPACVSLTAGEVSIDLRKIIESGDPYTVTRQDLIDAGISDVDGIPSYVASVRLGEDGNVWVRRGVGPHEVGADRQSSLATYGLALVSSSGEVRPLDPDTWWRVSHGEQLLVPRAGDPCKLTFTVLPSTMQPATATDSHAASTTPAHPAVVVGTAAGNPAWSKLRELTRVLPFDPEQILSGEYRRYFENERLMGEFLRATPGMTFWERGKLVALLEMMAVRVLAGDAVGELSDERPAFPARDLGFDFMGAPRSESDVEVGADRLASALERNLLGRHAIWGASSRTPAADPLVTWLLEGDPGTPPPALSPQHFMNCMRLPMYAAAFAGVTDRAYLRDLVLAEHLYFQTLPASDGSLEVHWRDGSVVTAAEGSKLSSILMNCLTPYGRNAYFLDDRGSGMLMKRGDIVFFSTPSIDFFHVAVASGWRGANGWPVVYDFGAGLVWPKRSQVSASTIDELIVTLYGSKELAPAGFPAENISVSFGRPPVGPGVLQHHGVLRELLEYCLRRGRSA
ncbi:M20/M25/M40 family metallo-hydrolase [Nocardia carnea]|uniref:M20/M25/M40 family metallo-hydrolase n=1 Tax=Nocardia carnea TaxID=37328 RepID=UPI0024546320|nr:M20/M25/M40 family metallo-hydrolase [Nocardia carnea]